MYIATLLKDKLMKDTKMLNYVKDVLKNMPDNWLNLTTHRLDIYNEKLAKTQFLEAFNILFKAKNCSKTALNNLPTAYDYIRLGHPLSCVLEWVIAQLHAIEPKNIICFSSQTMAILAVLRKNSLENIKTQILYTSKLPAFFNAEILRNVYGYTFNLEKIENLESVSEFTGSTLLITHDCNIKTIGLNSKIDFYIYCYSNLGSLLLVNGKQNESYISDLQHVRRRETIAMTPKNCHIALKCLVNLKPIETEHTNIEINKSLVLNSIAAISGVKTKALVASSGLSMQYAILMGLIHEALEKHIGKAIKIIVPPNCYGGTNDQARRVAASIDNVEVVDLLVDGNHNMVKSIDVVLHELAKEDAIPLIIAEIPTNPRVEVPNLIALKKVLNVTRQTKADKQAVTPVFILDQTFCPNIQFLGDGKILSSVKTISYVSGSKFPSGGLCTGGYCIGNSKANALIDKIKLHLTLCDNEATNFQYQTLANQLPSMTQRIADAYNNTRNFVNYIKEKLPEAKINFVSETLAKQGFTPSVFSLDLPTKGNTAAEREIYKRALNHKLINFMTTKIPNESKHCVSYGQLKGSYWTIPATSTQGTTKEGDKDYIARVALSPDLDLERHKKVFLDFVESI